jgi:hypothetical protein
MSKTLLRRHLTMRFQELIGNDLQTRKNQYEKSPNYQSLTPHTKIKVIIKERIFIDLIEIILSSFHVVYSLIDEHVQLKLMILFVQ